MTVRRLFLLVALLLVATPVGVAQTQDTDSCFGARARDEFRPCHSSRLLRPVTPTPAEALLESYPGCRAAGRIDVLYPCAFGPQAPSNSTGELAIVGDSHASHWRPAIDQIAARRNVQGMSLTRSGCPFSKAVARLRDPLKGQCIRWNQQVLEWFAQHPETRTVFISAHANGQVINAPGKDAWQTQVDGYKDAWAALPPTVQQIFVLRDVPRSTLTMGQCITKALVRHLLPGIVCATQKSKVLKPDPQIDAAKASGGRVKLIDLTNFFCGDRFCFPVIGRVLVHKDGDHMTQTFARTLAPYLMKAIGETR